MVGASCVRSGNRPDGWYRRPPTRRRRRQGGRWAVGGSGGRTAAGEPARAKDRPAFSPKGRHNDKKEPRRGQAGRGAQSSLLKIFLHRRGAGVKRFFRGGTATLGAGAATEKTHRG